MKGGRYLEFDDDPMVVGSPSTEPGIIVGLFLLMITCVGVYIYTHSDRDSISLSKIENAEHSNKEKKMDVLNLQKNDVITLEKGLDYVIVGLGWTEKDGIDVDVSAICLDEAGKCARPGTNLLFYGSPKNEQMMPSILNGALIHTGDDRTGGGGVDDPNEEIKVQLNRVPADVAEIVFFATIDESRKKLFTFADAPNSFIVVSDGVTDEVKAKYKLRENYRGDESIIAGSLKRSGNVWTFKAIGEGKKKDLQELITEFCKGNVAFK